MDCIYPYRIVQWLLLTGLTVLVSGHWLGAPLLSLVAADYQRAAVSRYWFVPHALSSYCHHHQYDHSHTCPSSNHHSNSTLEVVTLDYFVPTRQAPMIGNGPSTTLQRKLLPSTGYTTTHPIHYQDSEPHFNNNAAIIAASSHASMGDTTAYPRPPPAWTRDTNTSQQPPQQQQEEEMIHSTLAVESERDEQEDAAFGQASSGPALFWPLSSTHHCRFQWPPPPTIDRALLDPTASDILDTFDDAVLVVTWPLLNTPRYGCRSVMELYHAASEHARLMRDAGLVRVQRLLLLLQPPPPPLKGQPSVADDDMQRLLTELEREDGHRVRTLGAQVILSVVMDGYQWGSEEEAEADSLDQMDRHRLDDTEQLLLDKRQAQDGLPLLAVRSTVAADLFRPFTAPTVPTVLLYSAQPIRGVDTGLAGISDYMLGNWTLFLMASLSAGYVLLREDRPRHTRHPSNRSQVIGTAATRQLSTRCPPRLRRRRRHHHHHAAYPHRAYASDCDTMMMEATDAIDYDHPTSTTDYDSDDTASVCSNSQRSIY